jgi:hypothetical protein
LLFELKYKRLESQSLPQTALQNIYVNLLSKRTNVVWLESIFTAAYDSVYMLS